VLQALPRVDRILVMGDTVGYGADPNLVIDRLKEAGARAVRGNHDQAVLTPRILAWFNPDAAAAIQWTIKVLTPENRSFLQGLPTFGRVGRNRFVHGSPKRPYLFEYILEEEQAREHLERLGEQLCFYGHTHLPRIFTQAGEFVPPVQAETEWFEVASSALVNPGSVGQPRDGHPDAAFALVDLGQRAVQFRRVPYDVPRTQAKILDAGLPPIEAARLAFGR
jgi:diadenosine tetraphosphatase ApaH/serine/threonine PP2A family protein phosphatase